ncbi:MAG: Putative ATP /GTP binding protein [uncultured Sulfurovum sp.]|uniref:ATP /GTP binding protein n=1 Tax=uncultured Sulfurovum sp. TaxID=269237 RepID=A0A6S6SX59_9BACT|nr:MAG: Putative ATP /GTP binding protein [uncultured Sulfurovum sp.]
MTEVSKNYFLLFHSRNSQDITFAKFKELNQDEYSIYSLVLSISKNYISKMIDMNSFQELLEKMEHPPVSNISDLLPLKNSILALLASEDSSYDYKQVLEDIEYLREEEIISKVNYQKLLSLFHKARKPTRKIESKVEENSFLDSKIAFQETIKELSTLFVSNNDKTSLLEIEDYLLSQRFSVGITGVINAGKSTLINSLLGKEILGNSMVPETANLTIIKEGKPSAHVSYWNEKEWEKISATTTNRMENTSLVEQYIHKESYQQNISIEKMREFTSATASKDNHYKLVKAVELYQEAPFLSAGVEIVDTPGLDDPVILREEISKEYLSQCDAMIHLMNVNQSATQKDVEFIIDALLYQKISHLLIVLSHADTVTTTEMEEVIAYTKSSISSQLEALGKSSHLSFILQNIHFLPVSAKAALAYRTQKDVQKEQIKATGILAIEAHLEQLLYGKDALKAELVLHKSKEKLRYFIEEQQAKDSYQLSLFSQNKEELEESLVSHQAKSQRAINALRNDIKNLQKTTSDYVERLDVFLDEEFIDLKVLLTQRIFSDVQYTYQKSKKKPDENRIKIIIATTIKDGVLEITRDCGYKLHKRCEQLIGGCQKRFEILKNSQLNFLKTEFERLFSEPFYKGFLTFSTEEVTQDVLQLIAKNKPKEFDLLHVNLNETISEKMDVEQIKTKAHDKSLARIEAFFQLFYTHIEHIEKEEKNEEKMLEESIRQFEHRDDSLEDSISSLLSRKEKLSLILQRLEA